MYVVCHDYYDDGFHYIQHQVFENFDNKNDIYASEAANVSIMFGILGIITGSIWAKFTWSQWPLLSIKGWWVNDVKLNGAAVCMLVYMAYLVLRSSLDEE